MDMEGGIAAKEVGIKPGEPNPMLVKAPIPALSATELKVQNGE
jgi:hypothetical protein